MYKNPIILFDGVCNLCNSSVQYVLKHDSKNIFMFASLQSPAGQALLAKYHLPLNTFNSFVLINEGKTFLKSSAALHVAKKLNGPIKLLFAFIIVPAFIRNGVYNLIAKNRYKWFGKTESCMMPTKDLQNRFL
jgi:predicted DCC family thiol-disulfide oxidoreductase YuxK